MYYVLPFARCSHSFDALLPLIWARKEDSWKALSVKGDDVRFIIAAASVSAVVGPPARVEK